MVHVPGNRSSENASRTPAIPSSSRVSRSRRSPSASWARWRSASEKASHENAVALLTGTLPTSMTVAIHLTLVPYVVIKEVARHRKRLGGFVHRQRQARHCAFVLTHGANPHSRKPLTTS